MEFLSQTYVALRGPTGAPQTASDTIARLSDRLSPATLLSDRRAAVLALKGLARDCKQDVGERALVGLLQVLYNDAEVDSDIGKAVLETLSLLCDVEEGRDLGYKHSDAVLASDKTVHTLFSLLADNSFYLRFSTLQFLSTLLHNRRQVVQGYFLTASAGPTSVISVLEDKREIIRNEAISVVQALVSQSPDIQKILAFQGAFEKLFNIIRHEGGVDGGAVAQEALACVDALLRFNSSNQSYFRETGLPPVLCTLLQFPPNIQYNDPAPQEFALQFWDQQKLSNASYVVAILGMLVGSKGNSEQEASVFTRCLVEIALASNAPTQLKSQSLYLLPSNLNFPLSELTLTPYMPVPETNGEEWDRLEPASALDALVELALHGEYNGLYSDKRFKDGLELRAAAATVFENFVRKDEIKQAIVQAMIPPEEAAPSEYPPTTPLLHSLAASPDSTPAIDSARVTGTQFASLLFAHLLRSSSGAKSLARGIVPHLTASPELGGEGGFFVPADGAAPPPPSPPEADDDEPPQTLLQILTENLSLALLSRSHANTSDRDSREWDRLIVGYLTLLSQWLWDDPAAVRDFLNAGGLGVLVEPINHISDSDSIVPGLCAFLLGVCYEFNREPGEITRHTIHPILHRLGVDSLVGCVSRLREDERFKSVGPDAMVFLYPPLSHIQPSTAKSDAEVEGEIWFDWAFVDFWKSNYYTVQRGFSTAPDQLSSSSGQNAETMVLVASLRETIRKQSEEITALQTQLREKTARADEATTLKEHVSSLTSQLESSESKRKDVEKEQEDLLVLLDEVSSKRRRDKDRLRGAGLDVSEDEEDDDEDVGSGEE
ncbi:p115 like vesicle tethering protein [Desarmillaria tabescens]|uniref:P115 like vesicle tethering protein n=1 Tax=Armillaria tabescens TaxID=1929756 RepID=A0AA39KG57_ARMTA|nr:p115 like vesicle tethering protein [Desarmillaria tabescens]KAK0459266.1 p115 like vesicle tethering protein [Desarmillaria tabescens]